MRLLRRIASALLSAGVLAACGAPSPPEAQSTPAGPAPVSATPAPDPLPSDLTQQAIEMQDRILSITGRDSLRRFAELADQTPGFASNFDGIDHFHHWSLLRRTGVDPLRKIEDLFTLPYGVREVGAEIWYIWPDFAAMDSDDLVPERLSFQDRVRLQELIGEEEVDQLRATGVYPGLRTAISDTGRWIYYVNDIGQSERPDP